MLKGMKRCLQRTYPVMVSEARQVWDYFSNFHLGHDSRHIPPQVAFVQLLTGKRHLQKHSRTIKYTVVRIYR